jgi:hypothetical protein
MVSVKGTEMYGEYVKYMHEQKYVYNKDSRAFYDIITACANSIDKVVGGATKVVHLRFFKDAVLEELQQKYKSGSVFNDIFTIENGGALAIENDEEIDVMSATIDRLSVQA